MIIFQNDSNLFRKKKQNIMKKKEKEGRKETIILSIRYLSTLIE